MTHGLALGGREASDITDDRLRDVVLNEGRRTLLGIAADLADHDNCIGVRIGLERCEAVDVGRADDGVATDSDCSREAKVAQFIHHLVRQGA